MTPTPRARPPRALTLEERQAVLDVLHTDRFVDLAPTQIWARLLEEHTYYLCSVRTMYRILAAHAELRERRNQLRHPTYAKPELLATRPNEVWSWDITKLKGPVKWTSFYLYVLLDIYSRYVVGWMVADREASRLAKRLIEESCETQQIEPGQLTNPRGSRSVHDVEAGRPAPCGSGSHEIPLSTPCLQRQSVLGGAVQDAQVPARVSGSVRVPPG